MLGKVRLNSLASKLFLLIFLLIVSIAVPFVGVVYYNVLGITSKFEENSFVNSMLLIEENLHSNYVNLLFNQASDIIERKKLLKMTATLARDTLHEFEHIARHERREVLTDWMSSLMSANNFFTIIENGKPAMKSAFYNILASQNKRSDLKRQKFEAMLHSSNLPSDGTYLVYNINAEELETIRAEFSSFPSSVYKVSRKLLALNLRVPVLIYFLPVGEKSVILVASFLSDVQYEANYKLNATVESMQEKFASLEFYPRSILALISGDGKLLASRGNIQQKDVPFIPKELFEKARTEQYATLRYDNNFAQAENPFLNQFGSTILRLNYFKSLDWYTLAAAPLDVVTENSNQLIKKLAAIMPVVIIFCFILTLYVAYKFTNPIRILTQKVKDFGNADVLNELASDTTAQSFSQLCKDLPINRNDEVGELATSFNALGNALDENIHNLLQSKSTAERIQGEINAAREIQMSILPTQEDAPHLDNFCVSGFLEPAKEIGGDLYDFFELTDGRQVIVIGDVSGKGIAAALFMSMTVTLVRDAMSSGLAPHEAMERINGTLSKNNATSMFVTLIIAIFDPKSGDFVYANAGHCYPIIVDENGLVELKQISGMMVGPMPNMKYVSHTANISANGICFLYTDGISEAMDEQDNLYGSNRLYAALELAANKNSEEIIADVYNDVLLFRGYAEQSDDITMLCFKRING